MASTKMTDVNTSSHRVYGNVVFNQALTQGRSQGGHWGHAPQSEIMYR